MLPKVALMSQLSKTVSDDILSFPEHFLVSFENTSFLCTKLCVNPRKKIIFAQFLKYCVIWCSTDFGDQEVSHGPLEPQLFVVVPNILHTYTVRFLRFLVFSKPSFFTFCPKSQQNDVD